MDDIQRRLMLIDSELERKNFFYFLQSRCPLLLLASGLIAGILLQSFLPIPLIYPAILTLITSMAAAIIYSRKKNSNITAFIITTALISSALLGMIRLAAFNHIPNNSLANSITDKPKLVTIRGKILTEPRIRENKDWQFSDLTYTDKTTSFYLTATESQTDKGWEKTNTTIYVTISEPVTRLTPGDHIEILCRLNRFSAPTNPAQFDIKQYMVRKKVLLAAHVKSNSSITLLHKKNKSLFYQFKNKVKTLVDIALIPDNSLESQNTALLEALLLGQRHNINSDVYLAFKKTGLLHFISLSGMHFGILVAMIWFLCKTAGLTKPARAMICIIVTSLFILAIPPRAPTIRAAIICWMFCLSFLISKTPNSFNSLSLSAIVLLLIKPTAIFNAGFQLSFTCVISILIFCCHFEMFLCVHLVDPFFNKLKKQNAFSRTSKRVIVCIIAMFTTGLSAWLGGAGILLYHFNGIQPLTTLWTVLVFPFVVLILIIGFAKIIIFFMLPTAAALLEKLLFLLTDIMIAFVKFIADLNLSVILIGKVSVLIILFYYTFILFAKYARLENFRLKKLICNISVILIITALTITKYHNTHPKDFTLHILNTGHGQAILAQSPQGQNILFDCGSINYSNIGKKIVNPFLDNLGIATINTVIISHNDIDHINGICEVAKEKKINSVLTSQAFLEDIPTSDTAKKLSNFLKTKNLQIKKFDDSFTLSENITIKKLWPTGKFCTDKTLSDNDRSVVSLIEYNSRKILLCGDITQKAQNQLILTYPQLKCDILIAPHHGSANTINYDFLKHISPEIIICSCSKTQYEKNRVIKKHPGSKFYYTPRDGYIRVNINKTNQMNISPYK
ncbi:MAG: DNA internalization-related competence protein ComEC/Rec2 [Planctomycetes bacterium]|nr:DNA internalization-related competence protein ComEC/Rec2 [Planctomycetota bacterium]